MFDIGFWEMSLIALIALIVLGPERLPSAARTVGLWIGHARRMVADVKSDINREIKASELKELESIKQSVQETSDQFKESLSTVNESVKSKVDELNPTKAINSVTESVSDKKDG